MTEDLVPQNPISISTWSRPTRVAFLINPQSTNDNEVNQIIRSCIRRWGGRFNGIFPTDGIEVPEQWWKAMVIHDPDIVYSLVPLDDQMIWKINRYILPARIVEVSPEDRERSSDNLIREYEIAAIDVEPLPRFIWSNRGALGDPFFLYLKDFWADTNDLTFILRNFGTLSDDASMSTAFRDVPHDVIECRTLTSKEILQRVTHRFGRAITPIDLCKKFASFPCALSYEQHTRGFHLVVGDTAHEAMYAWNRDLSWTSEGRTWFWLPTNLSENIDILKMLGELITHTFWAQGYERQGKVISYSLDEARLQQIAQRATEITRLVFQPIRLQPEQFPFPNSDGTIRRDPRHTEQVPLSESEALVVFPKPPFLNRGHPNFGWMVDFEIQYRPERYSYTNVRPHWHLPKRLGIASRFFDPHRECRIVSGGLPSGAVTGTESAVGIRIPSDRSVVWTYFEKHHSNTRGKSENPQLRFRSIRTSDKGRYLQGVISLFGNLFSCGSFFEDPYWRAIFKVMAGRLPNDLVVRKNRCVDILNKFFEINSGSVIGSQRVAELAAFLVHRLSFRDPLLRYLTKEQFRSWFGQLRQEALKQGRDTNWWQASQRFDDLKELEFRQLVEARVLFQGAEPECPNCGSRYWYSVDDLKSQMRCVGCFSNFSLQTELEWSYRLNDLVTNALRYHGTLTVIQALASMEDVPSGMFLFLPCQDIFEANKKKQYTDLDLILIENGKFVIGEVKSDSTAFDLDDFNKLGAIAEDLQPDKVVFAAPGEIWPATVHDFLATLKARLVPLQIEVQDLHLTWP